MKGGCGCILIISRQPRCCQCLIKYKDALMYIGPSDGVTWDMKSNTKDTLVSVIFFVCLESDGRS